MTIAHSALRPRDTPVTGRKLICAAGARMRCDRVKRRINVFELWFKDLICLSQTTEDLLEFSEDTIWLLAHILTRKVVIEKNT